MVKVFLREPLGSPNSEEASNFFVRLQKIASTCDGPDVRVAVSVHNGEPDLLAWRLSGTGYFDSRDHYWLRHDADSVAGRFEEWLKGR